MLDINLVFSYLKNKNIPCNKLIHLGANFAQGRTEYIQNGVTDIMWVEAIPEIAQHLKKTLAHTNDTVIQACLSDIPEQDVVFHVASNKGMSSSIFQFNKHKEKYPSISMTSDIMLKTNTLDNIILQNGILENFYNIMVMDLQGAELKTLIGSQKTINSIQSVVVEISKIELYEGAPLELEIDNYLKNLDFHRAMDAYTEYGWGEALYIKNQ